MSATEEFGIDVDRDSIRVGTGNTTGRIAIRAENQYFPEHDWDDFVVVILGWWIQSFLCFVSGSASLEFAFMDGPFRIIGTRVGDRRIELVLMRGNIGGSVEGHVVVDEHSVRDALRRTANAVIRRCMELHESSDDLEVLQTQFAALAAIGTDS